MTASAAIVQASCRPVVAVAVAVAVALYYNSVDQIVDVVCFVPAHQRIHYLAAVAEAVWLYSNQIHQKYCSSAAGAAVAACSGLDSQIDHLLVGAAVEYFELGRQRGFRSAAGAVFAARIRIDLYFVEAVGYLHPGFQRAQSTVAVEICLCSY